VAPPADVGSLDGPARRVREAFLPRIDTARLRLE
jgi:hypothetical protein